MAIHTVSGAGCAAGVIEDQGSDDLTADKIHLLSFVKSFSDVRIYDKKALQEGVNQGVLYGVKREGRIIELDPFGTGPYYGPSPGGRRGQVKEFSWASRRRLLKLIGRISWAVLGQVWFVTLTYPEGPCAYRDGPAFKKDLQALRRRIERRYGRNIFAVWKMEFQWKTRGGVPHFHLLLKVPGVGFGESVKLGEFRSWVAGTWYEIVGSGDVAHLAAGTGVEVARTDCARYFSYALKEKGRQNTVPEWMPNPGRLWGVWRMTADPSGSLMTQADWIELRRMMRKWDRARGRGKRNRGRLTGEWFLVDAGKSSFGVLCGERGIMRGLGHWTVDENGAVVRDTWATRLA